MLVHQILREWPPGFGGIERVAHELGNVWGGVVYSLDVQNQRSLYKDPLKVLYQRQYLSSFHLFGRLHLPMPSRALLDLLCSTQPLHGHLPSPGVLFVLLFARFLRPRRRVTCHWHCFLEPQKDLGGYLFRIYQWMSLLIVPRLSAIVTTSPTLAVELERRGCRPGRLFVLPCCLSEQQEQASLDLSTPIADEGSPLRVLFVGRLDSYKRLDWLLESLISLHAPWTLSVVGDGPKRLFFEELALKLLGRRYLCDPELVQFHGRLTEVEKYKQIAAADLLVLPSESSNEAFGIVQLEAMAAGRPALAFDLPRSGMGWVGQLPSLKWSQTPAGLGNVLQVLSEDPGLRAALAVQARQRYLRMFARAIWAENLVDFGDLGFRG